MQMDDAALEALIDANVAWLGLTIDPDWRPAIKQNLLALAGAIVAIEALPLPDDSEPATVYEP